MDALEGLLAPLRSAPRAWLVTGAAGFIGSHLLHALLQADQHVVALDNFATGKRRNVDEVLDSLAPAQRSRLRFIEGDVRDAAACRDACAGVDVVLHQAALGSVPRSIENPMATHEANVTGFVQLLCAAREAGVKRVVYASSSSVYGDHPDGVRREPVLGKPLSPYAASKRADELYAAAFSGCYGMPVVGLRYFNVFGPRQDPQGPYAAVIPRWAAAMLEGAPVQVNGDGHTSRDFCHVANVVQANLRAATVEPASAVAGEVFNIGAGGRTSLLELFEAMRDALLPLRPALADCRPQHQPFRAGDVRQSQADITRAREVLGYEPSHSLAQGLAGTLRWYAQREMR